jgi:hypothetical protein
MKTPNCNEQKPEQKIICQQILRLKKLPQTNKIKLEIQRLQQQLDF